VYPLVVQREEHGGKKKGSVPVQDFSVGMDLPFSKNSSTPLGLKASCLRRFREGNERVKKDIVVVRMGMSEQVNADNEHATRGRLVLRATRSLFVACADKGKQRP